MKRILIVSLAVCFAISVQAGGDKNIVSSVLKSAMVYRSGAELTHTAKVLLNQGNNDIVIDNISNRIDINSLQIGATGNVTILSVEFSTNFLRPEQKLPIQMELQDQYPLSTTKDIEVELLQHEGAAVNEETGILTWKLQLAPGEIKKLRLSYSVKYPKDKMISL
jgi:hypothetical protein